MKHRKGNNVAYRSVKRIIKVINGMKRCARCRETKSVDEFHSNAAHPTGYCAYCKGCAKDQHLGRYLRHKYGVTLEWYEAKMAKQGGVCAVCKKNEVMRPLGEVLRLAVDHDHDTGAPRGLLCNRCNCAVAGLENLIRDGVFDTAVDYLKRYGETMKSIPVGDPFMDPQE